MAVCLMSMMFYYGVEHVSATTPVTPVVQVRTYDAIHGKYPRALWRGSASIINNKWVLLTNNHVVEDLSEENAAGTEEASASMEEQSATIAEIADSGESLAEIAQELQSLVAKFKI